MPPNIFIANKGFHLIDVLVSFVSNDILKAHLALKMNDSCEA